MPGVPRRSPSSDATGDAAPAKRDAILAAALDEFVEKGFALARMDAVATRAGVAKGTLYLYFASKQALLEALIHVNIGAQVAAIGQAALQSDKPTGDLLRMIFGRIRAEILGTRRREVARLVIAEAGRVPEIAALYHREVITPGLAMLRALAERGVARGEFGSDALVRFPHLAIAPVLVALLWTSFFDGIEPLDVEGMLDAHVGVLMRGLRGEA